MLACHSYAVGTQNLFNKPEMLKTKIPQSVRRRHAIANFSFVFRKKIRTEVPSPHPLSFEREKKASFAN